MNEQLKACPFCGSDTEMRLYDCEYFAQCIECFNSTAADHQTEVEAAAAWNRRAQDFDTLAQRLQEAERLLQIAYDHGRYRRLSDQELGQIEALKADAEDLV